MSEQSLRWRFT